MRNLKKLFIILTVVMVFAGCGKQSANELELKPDVFDEGDVAPDDSIVGADEDSSKEESVSDATVEDETATDETATTGEGKISEDDALAAIQNYCYATIPDLKEDVEAGLYNVSWEVTSCDDSQVVVLYHSYTAAEVRYYIDRATGETYSTEFVEGITPEEERTDVSFNVKDYISDSEN